jgi:hypothetical protein
MPFAVWLKRGAAFVGTREFLSNVQAPRWGCRDAQLPARTEGAREQEQRRPHQAEPCPSRVKDHRAATRDRRGISAKIGNGARGIQGQSHASSRPRRQRRCCSPGPSRKNSRLISRVVGVIGSQAYGGRKLSPDCAYPIVYPGFAFAADGIIVPK